MPIRKQKRPILDTALVISGILVEVAFAGLLVYRRAYRTLPVFFAYILWGIASDCVMFLLHSWAATHYVALYIGELSIDSALQFGVLVELTWSALRSPRTTLPRGTFLGVVFLFLLLGAAAWPITDSHGFAVLSGISHFMTHLQQEISVLRIAFFLALAATSQLLAIDWRDRELQVATGLGFFSLLSLSGSVLHAHQVLTGHFHAIDQVVSASYLLSLIYWVRCYCRADAPRRQFTPQMEKFIVTLAGEAHAQRVRLADSRGHQAR